MDYNMMLSAILAIICIYAGIQVRSGNTKSIGIDLEQISPELRPACCKELSLPVFVLGLIEAVDVILMLMKVNTSTLSLIVLGAGIVICLVWMTLVTRKYKKK